MRKINLNNMNTTKKGDETYIPFYAVEPILKYLKPNSKILCPFDEYWSAFVVLLKEKGHTVYESHIYNYVDFFDYKYEDVEEYDYIISNPPFSIKDKVLTRLYQLKRPFIMLLPVATIQSSKRVPLFIKNGIEILVFDKRISYHQKSFFKVSKGAMFASAYFCWNVLPDKLIFENLGEFKRTLNDV